MDIIPITIGLKREAPGVSTEAISTRLQGTCLEDSMMMNKDAYDNSLKRYIQTEYGLPMSMDLDKHPTGQSTAKLSVQDGSNNSVSLSEFEKGLKELRMEALHANSPQAKSRIKWLFRTLQDRWVKAIRLREIRTIEKGNRFLEGFLPLYNKREDTELWTEMRKSIVAQMVRSFFDGGYLYTLKPIKECVDRRQDNLYA